MTMELPDPGVLYGQLSQRAREQCLEEIAADSAEFAKVYKDALEEGLGLPKPRPAERLAFYRSMETKFPGNLAALQAEFPDDYQALVDDWRNLEEAAQRKQAVIKASPMVGPQLSVAAPPLV